MRFGNNQVITQRALWMPMSKWCPFTFYTALDRKAHTPKMTLVSGKGTRTSQQGLTPAGMGTRQKQA